MIPIPVWEEFIALGAVKYSNLDIDGDPLYEITHFWDAKDREIGFYNSVLKVSDVIAPNYRQWHQSFLEAQRFHPINEYTKYAF